MKQISIFKVLFFLLVVLPLAVFVLGVFIIPLVVILLILSIFWSGKVFRFGGTFRQNSGTSDGYWQEEKREAANDCVDVESTVVESTPVDNGGESNTEKKIAVLPESKQK